MVVVGTFKIREMEKSFRWVDSAMYHGLWSPEEEKDTVGISSDFPDIIQPLGGLIVKEPLVSKLTFPGLAFSPIKVSHVFDPDVVRRKDDWLRWISRQRVSARSSAAIPRYFEVQGTELEPVLPLSHERIHGTLAAANYAYFLEVLQQKFPKEWHHPTAYYDTVAGPVVGDEIFERLRPYLREDQHVIVKL